jgi:hypothetical protein
MNVEIDSISQAGRTPYTLRISGIVVKVKNKIDGPLRKPHQSIPDTNE